MTTYGTKDWFENKFINSEDSGDNWGHSYRYSQIYRTELSLSLIIEEIRNSQKKILDIGCANCDFTSSLYEINKKNDVFGCDISENAILYNKSKFKEINFSVETLPILNYEHNKFDVITSLEVLNYLSLENQEKSIKEIKRCLKDEGLYLFSGVINSGEYYFKEDEIVSTIKKHFQIEKIQYNYNLLYNMFEYFFLGIIMLENCYNNDKLSVESLTNNKRTKLFLENKLTIKILKIPLKILHKPSKIILKQKLIFKFLRLVTILISPKMGRKQIFILAKNVK